MMDNTTTATFWDLTSRLSPGEGWGTWARPEPNTPSPASRMMWSVSIARDETNRVRGEKYNLVSANKTMQLFDTLSTSVKSDCEKLKDWQNILSGKNIKMGKCTMLSDFNLRSFFLCLSAVTWHVLVQFNLTLTLNRAPLTVNNES